MSGWRELRGQKVQALLHPGTRIFQKDVHDGHVSVFASEEPDGFHLSISHRTNGDNPQPGRYPTWDEIHDARYRFAPLNLTMAMLLPPQDEYVNVHATTFHLWSWPSEDAEPPC